MMEDNGERVYFDRPYRIRRNGQPMTVKHCQLCVGDMVFSCGQWWRLARIEGIRYYFTDS